MALSKKNERQTQSLFDHYKKEMQSSGLPVFESIQNIHHIQVKSLLESFSEYEMKEMISFAVSNWEVLRDADDLFQEEISWHKLIAPWVIDQVKELMKDPDILLEMQIKKRSLMRKEEEMQKIYQAYPQYRNVKKRSREEILEEIKKKVITLG